MIYVMHVTATQAILSSSLLERRAQVLRDIASGAHLTTLAFSEKGSRSQFWAPVSSMSERNGDLITCASKSWVTSANHAHSYVSSAQRPGAGSPLESTVYLLGARAAGVRVTSRFDGLGLRGNDSAPVEGHVPKAATTERSVRARGKRVYIDCLQNILGKTLAAAYSARASEYAGVSTPVTWQEIDEGFDRKDFTIETAPARFQKVGDLWAKLRKSKGVDLKKITSLKSEI
jgi:alkylation response protein AidB-like acyl-CoA dehydrogenase